MAEKTSRILVMRDEPFNFHIYITTSCEVAIFVSSTLIRCWIYISSASSRQVVGGVSNDAEQKLSMILEVK